MKNICLTIAYDGLNYAGWQKQHHATTIQGEIEKHLLRLTGKEIALHGAGRTDAGVHADAMTAHFHHDSRFSPQDFLRGLNGLLEDDIRVMKAEEVAGDFHARFSARGKEYHYTVFTGEVIPPVHRGYMLHQSKAFHWEVVEECLQLLIGTHDFSSFENTGTRDKTITTGKGAVRTLNKAYYRQIDNNVFQFVFIGEGFLRNMVRNMVGSLMEVGRGKKSVEWFETAFRAMDRNAAGPTAPAHGLKLHRVIY